MNIYMTEFWIDAYYALCFVFSVAAAVVVMWNRIPTGISGTVGFTLIALVLAGITTDWMDSHLPWIGVKRGLILWAGVLMVIYWAVHKPWRTWERRIHRPVHRREEDVVPRQRESAWPESTPDSGPDPLD